MRLVLLVTTIISILSNRGLAQRYTGIREKAREDQMARDADAAWELAKPLRPISVASPASPDEVPQVIKDALAENEAKRKRDEDSLRSELNSENDELRRSRAKRDGRTDSIQKSITALQKRLSEIRSQQGMYLPQLGLVDSVKGDIGSLNKGMVFKVVQVVDQSNVLLAGTNGTFYWVTDTKTDEMTDGAGAKFVTAIEVRGTKQYQSTLGSTMTVKMLAPIEMSGYQKVMKAKK